LSPALPHQENIIIYRNDTQGLEPLLKRAKVSSATRSNQLILSLRGRNPLDNTAFVHPESITAVEAIAADLMPLSRLHGRTKAQIDGFKEIRYRLNYEPTLRDIIIRGSRPEQSWEFKHATFKEGPEIQQISRLNGTGRHCGECGQLEQGRRWCSMTTQRISRNWLTGSLTSEADCHRLPARVPEVNEKLKRGSACRYKMLAPKRCVLELRDLMIIVVQLNENIWQISSVHPVLSGLE